MMAESELILQSMQITQVFAEVLASAAEAVAVQQTMCRFEVFTVELHQELLRQWLDVFIDFGVAKDYADLM